MNYGKEKKALKDTAERAIYQIRHLMWFASKAQRHISFSTEDLTGQENEDRRLRQKADIDGITSGGSTGPPSSTPFPSPKHTRMLCLK